MKRRRCVYCGSAPATVERGGKIVPAEACTAHVDLLRLDPHYGLVDELARDTGDRLELDASYRAKVRQRCRPP